MVGPERPRRSAPCGQRIRSRHRANARVEHVESSACNARVTAAVYNSAGIDRTATNHDSLHEEETTHAPCTDRCDHHVARSRTVTRTGRRGTRPRLRDRRRRDGRPARRGWADRGRSSGSHCGRRYPRREHRVRSVPPRRHARHQLLRRRPRRRCTPGRPLQVHRHPDPRRWIDHLRRRAHHRPR